MKWVGDAVVSGNPISSSSAVVFLGLQINVLLQSGLFWLVIAFLPMVVIDGGALRVILTALMVIFFMKAIRTGYPLLSKWSMPIILFLVSAAFVGLFYSGFYVTIFSGRKYKFVFNDANNYGAYAIGILGYILYSLFRNRILLRVLVFGTATGGMLTTIYLSQSRMYSGLAVIMVLLFTVTARSIPLVLLIVSLSVSGLISTSVNLGRLLDTSLSGRDIIWLGALRFISSNWESMIFFPHGKAFEKMFGTDIFINGGHSLCENSYLAVLICGGGIFFFLYLSILSWSLLKLWMDGFPRTMLLLGATMVIWFFDDSLIYPISTYFQLFGVYCMSLHERAQHYPIRRRQHGIA